MIEVVSPATGEIMPRKFIDMPDRIAALPRDERGYPVPKFVAWVDSVPDFRLARPDYVRECVMFDICWLCGQPLGTFKAFVIGPMCAINRVSAEPPCHRDCARFAARNCPFLVRPKARRREANLPADRRDPGGLMILRNPGVVAVWVTKSWERFRPERGSGALFRIGPATAIEWYCEGRAATGAEIDKSVESGFPAIEEEAARLGTTRQLMIERRQFDQLLNSGGPQ